MAHRLDPQTWMIDPATRRVVVALAAGGAGMRFVGGCVRDALLGRPIGDIDIATDAAPDRVMALLHEAGLKALPTGLAHGRSEEHTSELQSLMRISYAVFCLKKKNTYQTQTDKTTITTTTTTKQRHHDQPLP